MTIHPFLDTLEKEFRGVISHGGHEPGPYGCVFEIAHMACHDSWNDCSSPWPDFRKLNDAKWSSDKQRTMALCPLIIAYWDWPTWGGKPGKQGKIVARLLLLMGREILPYLPELFEDDRSLCRGVTTLTELYEIVLRIHKCHPGNWPISDMYETINLHIEHRYRENGIMAICARIVNVMSFCMPDRTWEDLAARDIFLHHACHIWIQAAKE